MQNHRNDKPPPPRSIPTHDALCKFFLPLRAFCRFFAALYVAIAPYELFLARSMSLSLHTSSGGALSAKPIRDACGYAIARKRPIRSAIALLPAAIRALGRALCRYRSIRALGAAQAAVVVVKNCYERDEWPLQSSSIDDCMTNAKKSSKEPPVVRLPSRSYSHALHI